MGCQYVKSCRATSQFWVNVQVQGEPGLDAPALQLPRGKAGGYPDPLGERSQVTARAGGEPILLLYSL
jgi:hypothetical protein